MSIEYNRRFIRNDQEQNRKWMTAGFIMRGKSSDDDSPFFISKFSNSAKAGVPTVSIDRQLITRRTGQPAAQGKTSRVFYRN